MVVEWEGGRALVWQEYQALSVHCSTRQLAVHNLLHTPTESSALSPSLETFFHFKPSSYQFLTLTLVNEAKVVGAVLIKKLKNYFVLVNQL